ncbi:MAG: phosphopentomutase [Turicibacter sp.]|nr:phosphopentomutase [Turicibacter sp.]
MKKFKRIFLIVMDSAGVGELPDAAEFGDVGSNTFGNIAKHKNGLKLPRMERLGLGNLTDIVGVPPQKPAQGYYTKLAEASLGKDTMTGHWEIMGLKITEPFQTFTETGFPKELLDELKAKTGRGIVGNKSASGTEILDDLGEHHNETGDLIVYTSADSVLQIAANEAVIPAEELWQICKMARELTMKEEWKVGRVIARPFVGDKKGAFTRTPNRHDYALKPFGYTVLNALKDNGQEVIALGKINDIYVGEGITDYLLTKSNDDGMEKLLQVMNRDFTGLAFLNLVDFDAVYGHRRNPEGYGDALETFDQQLSGVFSKMQADDLLIITADHGNDPTAPGTDHTREYIPVLFYSPQMSGGGALEGGSTFASIGATIADNFGAKMPEFGDSYLSHLN